MARPPSGNPRNIVVNVRLTRGEDQALRDRYGTPGKGIRAILDKVLKPAESRAAGAAGEDNQAPPERAVTGVVRPRQSGKSKEAEKKIAVAEAEGKTVLRTEDLPPADELKGIPDEVKAHRHQRGVILRTDYVQGQAVKIYQCKVEGCQEELR